MAAATKGFEARCELLLASCSCCAPWPDSADSVESGAGSAERFFHPVIFSMHLWI